MSLKLDYTDWAEKGDSSITEICNYVLRDTLQWVYSWMGYIPSQQYGVWYVAYTTICDDLAIPPKDLMQGHFKIGGLSLEKWVKGAYEVGYTTPVLRCMLGLLLREYIFQYLEKAWVTANLDFRRIYTNGARSLNCDTAFRVMGADVQGCAIVILHYSGQNASWQSICASAIGCCLSMDFAKRRLGVLQRDRTLAVEGGPDLEKVPHSAQMCAVIAELCQGKAPRVLLRYGTSGLHYVYLLERYHERLNMRREGISSLVKEWWGAMMEQHQFP
ncbi:uncharacterized protein VTP21DRAFT_10254, partial [Calcarisporiella thermophila]|uniref:uncharacterized protein n=1 Tax=Calcarisporiella thermophila TaxID=911321 RepID=UPI00374241ED